jgi:hypothetical protein
VALVQKSATDDLVYKTHAEPAEQLAATGQADNDPWNRWCYANIQAALDVHDRSWHEAVGEVLVDERQLHRHETEKALAPLQHQLTELKAQIDTLIRLSGAKPADLASAIEAAKMPGPRGPQGPAGPRGARGERGMPAPTIVGWALDRERYLAYPLMSHGRPGPALELRGLFEQFQAQTSSLAT